MRYSTIVCIAILIIFSQCDRVRNKNNTIGNNISYDTTLNKKMEDTLKIRWQRADPDHPATGLAFNDNNAFCTLSHDSLHIKFHRGGIGLYIDVSNKKYWIQLNENSCTYRIKYKIIDQRFIINKSNFKVGDTITGLLFCKVIGSRDSLNKTVDSATISGKFKLKIRDEIFNWSSLDQEARHQELISELSNSRADTIKQFTIKRCGIDSIPVGLAKFKNLEELEISGVDLKNSDLSILCQFKKLKYLEISGVHLKNTDLSILCQCRKLKHLNVSGCNISKLPNCLFSLNNLIELNISGNEITTLPSELFTMKKLTILKASFNLLTTIPDEILNLYNLKVLDIDGRGPRNNIKKLPKGLFKKLSRLEEFNPPHCMDSSEYKDLEPVKTTMKL